MLEELINMTFINKQYKFCGLGQEVDVFGKLTTVYSRYQKQLHGSFIKNRPSR